jgi:hypothetical protein
MAAKFLGIDVCDKNNNSVIDIKTTKLSSGTSFAHTVHCINVRPVDSDGIVLNKSKSYGVPDDNTYELYPILQKLVPRCFSILEIGTNQIVVRGMPKFSAANADEEDDAVNAPTLLVEKAKATKLIMTEKANGKAFVVTAVKNENLGKNYWFGGSKNVHRLFEVGKKIDPNPSAQLVVDMFECFFESIKSSGSETKLFDHLLKNKLTICGEYVDGKHIVYVENPYIRWFGFTSSDIKSENLCLAIAPSLSLIKTLNLTPVNWTEKDIVEYKDKIADFRVGTNKEGWVLHWLNNENETIAMEKVKTIWYVVIRALRQIMMKNIHYSQAVITKIREVLFARNNSFMHLPLYELKIWFDMCCSFVQWFVKTGMSADIVNFIEKQKFHNKDAAAESLNQNKSREKEKEADNKVKSGMGYVWTLFLADTKYNDEWINNPSTIKKDNTIKEADFEYKLELPDKKANGLLVFAQGVPGLGKNYVGEFVKKDLLTKGVKTALVDQDMFIKTTHTNNPAKAKTTASADKSGVECRNFVYDLMEKKSVEVILLQRNNATKNQYDDIAKKAQSLGWKTILYEPQNYTDPKFILTCASSVLTRTGHSFDSLPAIKRLEIMVMFINFLKQNNKSDYINEYIQVPWIDTTIETPILDKDVVLSPECTNINIHKLYNTVKNTKYDFRLGLQTLVNSQVEPILRLIGKKY